MKIQNSAKRVLPSPPETFDSIFYEEKRINEGVLNTWVVVVIVVVVVVVVVVHMNFLGGTQASMSPRRTE